jgi:hypothetical protein
LLLAEAFPDDERLQLDNDSQGWEQDKGTGNQHDLGTYIDMSMYGSHPSCAMPGQFI